MLEFGLLMLVPVIIALIAMFAFKGKVTVGEFLGQVGVVALFIIICLSISYFGRTTDTEVWNGQITEKRPHVQVSCEHSYSCNPHPCNCDTKGNCSTCYDTCYEHNHDYDWDLAASTGEVVSIDRVDRQGNAMPPRWAKAYIGEPFASTHMFTNYILANPDSVLLGTKGDVERYKAMLPNYPDKVYDYYRHDPVINMGVPAIDMKVWNWLVGEVNKQLGPKKQVNVIVILVPTPNRDYMFALKDKWVGGKKNDVVVVIGSRDGHTIDWADVMSWSPKKDFTIALKNAIQDVGTLDKRDTVVAAIGTTVDSKFERLHMKTMKYMIRSFQPSGTAMVVTFILATLLSLGLALWTITNDIKDNDGPGWPRGPRGGSSGSGGSGTYDYRYTGQFSGYRQTLTSQPAEDWVPYGRKATSVRPKPLEDSTDDWVPYGRQRNSHY